MLRAMTEPAPEPSHDRRLRVPHAQFALASFLFAVLCLATPTPAARAEEIVIAAVTPRPGLAQSDPDIATAISLALAEIAKSGGLLGRTVRLISYEEDCSRAEAETTAGQIVARGASFVIGHACSAAAIAAAPVYARNRILMISPGARSPRLTEPRAGPSVFRLAGRDDRFGAETAALIASRFADRRVAIVNDKSLQARTLADAADREMRARGITPVLREAYIAGERAYNKTIDALAAAEADVVVVPAQPVEAGIILDGLRARKVGATLIGSEILAVPEIESKAKRAGTGIILMLPWSPAAANGAVKEGSTSTSRQPNESPAAVLVRAGIQGWAHAVRRAGTFDAEAVGRVLESEAASTALGALQFDLKGDALIPSFAPHTWVDGRWQVFHLEKSQQ